MKDLFNNTKVVTRNSDMWKKLHRFMWLRGIELVGASTEPDGTVNVSIDKHGMSSIGNTIGRELKSYLGVPRVNIDGSVA